MKQINVKLLAILFLSAVVTLAGAVVLYRFQMTRNADGLLVRAEAAMANEDFAGAARHFQRYLRLRPDDGEQYVNFANCLREEVNIARANGTLNARVFSRAYGVIEEALRKNPDNRDLRKSAADFSMQFRRYPDAISHLNFLLDEKSDDDGTLRVQLANCYAQSGQDEKAIDELCKLTGYDRDTRTFEAANATAPDSILAYQLLAAMFHIRVRDDTSAKAVVDGLVDANSDSYEAFLVRANFLTGIGTPPSEVEDDIKKALELSRDEPVTILSAADFYLKQKDFANAEKYYKECRTKFPDNIGAYRGLSNLALAAGTIDAAVEHLNAGLERDPENTDLLWARANIELENNEYEKVAETREALEKLNYARPFMDFLDARIDLAHGKWLVASKSFEKVRPQIAQYRPAWLPGVDGAMALCYERMGQHDLRLKACERIIEANPSNPKARWGKVQALLAMGQLDKATTEYETVEKQILATGVSTKPSVMTALLQMELLQQQRLPEHRRNYADAKRLATDMHRRGMLKDPKAARVVESYFVAIGEPEKGQQLIDIVKKSDPNDLPLFLNDVQRVATEEGIEKAIQMLNDAFGRFNNTTALRVTKCELLARTRPDECREELRLLEADLNSMPEARRAAVIRGMGRVYMLLQDFADTRRLWERLAADNPQDVQVRLSMFELAVQEGNENAMQSTIEQIENLIGKNSAERKWCEAVRIVWRVRQELVSKSELESAIGLLSEAIAQRDGWDALYRMQGEIYAMRDQPQAAIAALEKSLQLGVGHPNVFRNLAALYFAEGRNEAAERTLDKFPRPLWTQAEERMKMSLMAGRGKLPEKLPYDQNSEDPSDHLWVGKLLTNAGRMDKAEVAFQRAKKLAPDQAGIWSAMMRKYVVNKEMEKAMALIEESESSLSEQDAKTFKGEAYARLREWDKALKEFREAEKLAPESLALKRAIADVSLKAGKRDEANAILDQMLKGAQPNDPTTPVNVRWARRARAELLGSRGSYHDYTEALKLVEANGSDDGRLAPEDLVVLARLSLGRPDGFSREQAIKRIDKTKEQRRLVDAERRLLADLYRRQDRWTECKSVMMDLLADNPKDMQLLDPWLTWLLEHDELQQASRWVKNCPPNSIAAVRTLSHLDTRQNRPERAAKRLAALIPNDLDAKDADRLRLVGIIFEQLGEYDARMYSAAEKTLRRYAKLRPTDELALAGFLGRRGQGTDVSEAIDICAKEIESGVPARGFQMAVGVLRRNREVLAEPGSEIERRVRAMFEAASQADPLNAGLMIQRSEFEDLVGQPQEAEKWLKKYMELENVSATQRSIVANNLAYMLALQGETERSNEYIQIAVKTLGPTADLRDTTGMVYYAKGEYGKAIEEFEAALGDGGATAYKYVHLAMANLANGNADEAGLAFKRAIDLNLDTRQMSKLEIKSYNDLVTKLKAAGLITDRDLKTIE